MENLRYESPASLADATALLASEKGEVRVLAGGTDIIVQMHSDLIEPDLLIDIKNIPELTEIKTENNGFRFGAAVSGKELMLNEEFNKRWPGVMDGVRLIGSLQIRGRASVGGNLCNASPAADSIPPLITANAFATIVGPTGSRDMPVEEFITGPGETCLEKDEIVVSFFLPDRPPHSGDAYLRFTPRTEMDIAVVGVAVNLTLDDGGTCIAARVAVGAVAATPLLVPDAADALIGSKVDGVTLENLSAATSAACSPINDKRGTIEHRTQVAGVLAQRAAIIAMDRAGLN